MKPTNLKRSGAAGLDARHRAILRGAQAAAWALALIATSAHADGLRRAATPAPAAYATECASCHIGYAPGLLPAASWQRLMSQLRTHFGTDASIEPGAQAAIASWLVANAATGKRAREEPAESRITRAGWFVREHRELGAAVWSRPAIRSAANCAACHPKADQGDFDERAIRIPR